MASRGGGISHSRCQLFHHDFRLFWHKAVSEECHLVYIPVRILFCGDLYRFRDSVSKPFLMERMAGKLDGADTYRPVVCACLFLPYDNQSHAECRNGCFDQKDVHHSALPVYRCKHMGRMVVGRKLQPNGIHCDTACMGIHDCQVLTDILHDWALASYAVSVFGIAVCAVNMPTLKAYAYNAPLVITATVALFAFFLCLDIRSHTVNYIAKSAFAVYLLHKAPIVWGNAMKPAVVYLWESLPLAAFTFAAIGLMAGIYVLAMAIDALRRMISDKIFSYRV